MNRLVVPFHGVSAEEARDAEHHAKRNKSYERSGSANPDNGLSENSASMGDGNRLPRSRSNEKTPP